MVREIYRCSITYQYNYFDKETQDLIIYPNEYCRIDFKQVCSICNRIGIQFAVDRDEDEGLPTPLKEGVYECEHDIMSSLKCWLKIEKIK